MRTPLLLLFALFAGFTMISASSHAQALVTATKETAAKETAGQIQNIDLSAFEGVKKLLDAGQIDQAISQLESGAQQHENNPDYFNLLGVLYLQKRSFASAAASFERVILIQSTNGGAWLDLAMATAESGNLKTAEIYFDYIETHFSPSPSIRALIHNYRQRMRQLAARANHWTAQAELVGGYNTNVNNGLLERNIFITYLGEKLPLALKDSFQPRADKFAQYVANVRYHGLWLGQTLGFSAGVINRVFQKEHEFSYTDLNSAVVLTHKAPFADVAALLNVEHFFLNRHALLQNANFGISVDKAYGGCRLNLGVEYEMRRYVDANSKSLNGNTLWQQIASSCAVSNAANLQLNLMARIGRDDPASFRAGGVTHRHELSFRVGSALAQNLRAELTASISRAQDKEGYNPILENNAARSILRRNVKLQLSYHLNGANSLNVAVDQNTNSSNLSIFRQAGRVLNFGWQSRF